VAGLLRGHSRCIGLHFNWHLLFHRCVLCQQEVSRVDSDEVLVHVLPQV
jgi:hypothetical protein